jgi:NAD(P)-dependent dehydrogenase (short-subunit alcohol dehydrogenase family)
VSRLDRKVCIITGAGSGIGQATALLFAGEGARVIVADIDAAAGKETVRQITANGGEGSEHAVDVTDREQARRLADDAVERYGAIDVLFNNAGISGVGMLHETSLELWERVMRVNVTGVFLMTKYVVPHMMARRTGSIINMSSAIADIGLANRASYAASKGAVLSLTRSMQVDYAPFGIRVNALLPGTIHTPFVEKYLQESYPDREEGLAVIRKRQLTQELGTPEDAAAAALFLASDESRFVFGSALFVDGGMRGGK